jgi:hypothetical protein
MCHLFFNAQSKNGSTLKIHSEFTIRYNSLFPEFMPVNHNPEIKWLGVYKVPKKISKNFCPMNPAMINQFSITYLYNEYYPEKVCDTIEIDTGYTYFVGGNEGVNLYVNSQGDTIVDTTYDMFRIKQGDSVSSVPESYTYKWFYQNDDTPVTADSLLELSNLDTWFSITELKPPLFTVMKEFNIWLVIYDDFYGSWNHPKGYAVRGVKGTLKYTEAYRKSVE